MSVSVIVASTTRPCETTVPATVAELTMVASLIATATPTEAVSPSAADPSALAIASVFADVATFTMPPEVTLTPTGMLAVDVVETTAMAIAAATGMVPPCEVVALGVALLPEPSPPLVVACVLAAERSPCTWPSTLPPPFASLSSPFADAFERGGDGGLSDRLERDGSGGVDVPVGGVADTSWFTNASANETPTAADPLDVLEPSAVVITVFVAGGARPATVSEPSRTIGSPMPIWARRDTLEMVSATAGTRVIPSEPAPGLSGRRRGVAAGRDDVHDRSDPEEDEHHTARDVGGGPVGDEAQGNRSTHAELLTDDVVVRDRLGGGLRRPTSPSHSDLRWW